MKLTPKGYVLEPGDHVKVYDAVPVYSDDGKTLLYTKYVITVCGTLSEDRDK
jgi:hypothetical protein